MARVSGSGLILLVLGRLPHGCRCRRQRTKEHTSSNSARPVPPYWSSSAHFFWNRRAVFDGCHAAFCRTCSRTWRRVSRRPKKKGKRQSKNQGNCLHMIILGFCTGQKLHALCGYSGTRGFKQSGSLKPLVVKFWLVFQKKINLARNSKLDAMSRLAHGMLAQTVV